MLMKFLIKELLLIIYFFSQVFLLNANNQNTNKTNISNSSTFESNSFSGLELCDSIFNLLKDNKLNPKAQNLISGGENNFPYNIIIEKNTLNDNNSLVIIFEIIDFYKNKELCLEIINAIYKKDLNISFLISYADNQNIFYPGMVNPSQVFLNSKNNFSALLLNFSKNKNEIISGGFGKITPMWMLKTLNEAYLKENISNNIGSFYLSLLSKLSFYKTTTLSTYLMNDIPSLAASFDINTCSKENIINIISSFADLFFNESSKENDYHYLMFSIFRKEIWLSESRIIKLMLLFVFFNLLFIFSLGFINTNLKNQAWLEIKNNLYAILSIIILSLLGSIVGDFIYKLFFPMKIDSTLIIERPFSIAILQMSISILFVSFFFLAEMLFKKRYITPKSIDFLILLTTFFNQFFFSLIDISLFPMFLGIFILSILSITVKKNWIHMIIFLLMILPFFPLTFNIYENSNPSSLYFYLYQRFDYKIYISLILMPIFLEWYRIINAIKKHFPKKWLFLIITISVYSIEIIIMIILNFTVFNKNTSNLSSFNKNNYIPSTNNISLSITDEKIFDETIRTLNISSKKQAEYISLQVIGKDSNPVLYSSNDYISSSTKSSVFSVPAYPPKNLIITYGTDTNLSEIKVELVYKENNKFYIENISQEAGEK